MEDFEKVIKGLEICSEHGSWHGLDCEHNEAYKDCPYRGCETGCIVTIAKDALELLKEQKKQLDFYKKHEHEVCENCPYKLEDIGDFSDGYHTFNDLYTQRAVLFATIVNQNLDKAWKSHKHEDGEPCFGGGWFIVAVDTPKGSYSYHYEDKYWDIFKCVELPVAKHWDGHTDKDVWRLLLLS